MQHPFLQPASLPNERIVFCLPVASPVQNCTNCVRNWCWQQLDQFLEQYVPKNWTSQPSLVIQPRNFLMKLSPKFLWPLLGSHNGFTSSLQPVPGTLSPEKLDQKNHDGRPRVCCGFLWADLGFWSSSGDPGRKCDHFNLTKMTANVLRAVPTEHILEQGVCSSVLILVYICKYICIATLFRPTGFTSRPPPRHKSANSCTNGAHLEQGVCLSVASNWCPLAGLRRATKLLEILYAASRLRAAKPQSNRETVIFLHQGCWWKASSQILFHCLQDNGCSWGGTSKEEDV